MLVDGLIRVANLYPDMPKEYESEETDSTAKVSGTNLLREFLRNCPNEVAKVNLWRRITSLHSQFLQRSTGRQVDSVVGVFPPSPCSMPP